MKQLFLLLLVLCLIFPLKACSAPDAGQLFEVYLWQKRLVLIFAPAKDDPNLQQQNALLAAVPEDLKNRDIIIWRFIHQTSTQKDQKYMPHLSTGPFYKEFSIDRDEFRVLLIGKDGEVKYESNAPISAQTLFDVIDAMPMRQREMRRQESIQSQ